MAEENREDRNNQFLEILCKSSGKVQRFAAGTRAEWALNLMNKNLEPGLPQGFVIAAIKEGEEEQIVFFGPTSVLFIYGEEWKLQTFTEEDLLRRREATGMVPDISEKFHEVKCRRTGKILRFAPGTRTDHALLHMGTSLALGVEAVKEGEKPIIFGPESFLANFGPGWSLQTIYKEGHGQERIMRARDQQVQKLDQDIGFSFGEITPGYILRIFLVFVLMFFMGAVFTVFLEYLPSLLSLFFSDS